jgi:prepilin-type processing-associated H-X9-DG protein
MGFFCVGNGTNRAYVDGHIMHYNQVDTLTWSPLMLKKVVEEIVYDVTERMKKPYYIPCLLSAEMV